MGEKQELRDRVEEYETLNSIAARTIIEQDKEIRRLRERAEQADGRALLAQTQAAEQIEELAQSARRSQEAYEALTRERGVDWHSIVDELATLINPRWSELHPDDEPHEHPVSLRDRLAHVLAHYDDVDAERNRVGDDIAKLTALIHAVHGRLVGTSIANLTPAELLVEIGDTMAAVKRQRNDLAAVDGELVRRKNRALQNIIEIAQGEVL